MDTKKTPVSDCFKSISELSTGLFKDNGSKFLAFAYPVTTEEQIKEIVQGLKRNITTPVTTAMPTVLGIPEPPGG